MQNYSVTLESPVSNSFRCQMAANSVDLDVKKKSVHSFSVDADLDTPWNVGLIVGASGSGKTTLAKQIFGKGCFDFSIDEKKPIIEQFPEDMDYEACQKALMGIGLTQVPCWIRPVYTLSNGQRSRAIAALQMAQAQSFVVDEWTSVVDRTVAKAMSNCLQKHARRTKTQVCALSCHYDVADWLNPDWVIDCNQGTFTDRRLLWQKFKRKEKIKFDIREVGPESWKYFSKYHYLTDALPGGVVRFFGLFEGSTQIGFDCFANYVPHTNKARPMQMHCNRAVIHPDYVGLGLGMQVINITSQIMQKEGFDVRAKFSSVPVAKAFEKSDLWQLISVQRFTTAAKKDSGIRQSGYRTGVKTYSYKLKGPNEIKTTT